MARCHGHFSRPFLTATSRITPSRRPVVVRPTTLPVPPGEYARRGPPLLYLLVCTIRTQRNGRERTPRRQEFTDARHAVPDHPARRLRHEDHPGPGGGEGAAARRLLRAGPQGVRHPGAGGGRLAGPSVRPVLSVDRARGHEPPPMGPRIPGHRPGLRQARGRALAGPRLRTGPGGGHRTARRHPPRHAGSGRRRPRLRCRGRAGAAGRARAYGRRPRDGPRHRPARLGADPLHALGGLRTALGARRPLPRAPSVGPGPERAPRGRQW